MLQTVTGGYIYDRKLVEHLRESGDEVFVVSLPWRNYVNHLLYNFSSALIHRISALELHILLEDELNHPSCIVLNQRLRNEKYPSIISIVHHLRMDEDQAACKPLHVFVEQKYLESVDGFIFNSRATESSVARFADGKPSVVAYPGKDRFSSNMTENEIATRSARKGPLGIIFLGNITPRKGLATLIRTLLLLPREEWTLTVIGSLERNKNYSERILDEVRSNHLDKNVIFTGPISDTEAAMHLRKNHVLAVPSFYEGFGLVYIEAMGFGLPVIGTNAGGSKEIIEHNVNGFITAPDDSSTLKEYLRRLNKDRAILQKMSINAVQSYQRFPCWQDTVTKIRNFLCTMNN